MRRNPEMHEIKVICAWCQEHMRGPKDSPHISHGICQKCFDQEMKEIKKEREKQLRRNRKKWKR